MTKLNIKNKEFPQKTSEIKEPSENPSGDTEDRQEYVQEEMKSPLRFKTPVLDILTGRKAPFREKVADRLNKFLERRRGK